ncbi:hypothetical protein TNCV_4268941 [Trichonephila clavipes]|nr:hypothetical protein TNCV_4268941 [Trichonephila clavipes]
MILTFNNPNLPATVKAGYLNCKIRPYVPNPLRCFKCQRFDTLKLPAEDTDVLLDVHLWTCVLRLHSRAEVRQLFTASFR